MKTLKVYSATKFGKTRAEVEREIQERWSRAERAREAEISPPEAPQGVPGLDSLTKPIMATDRPSSASGELKKGFLDDWMAKKATVSAPTPNPTPTPTSIPAPDPPIPTPEPPTPTPEPIPAPEPEPEEKPTEAIFKIR